MEDLLKSGVIFHSFPRATVWDYPGQYDDRNRLFPGPSFPSVLKSKDGGGNWLRMSRLLIAFIVFMPRNLSPYNSEAE